MHLLDLLGVVRRHWVVAVATMLIGLVAAVTLYAVSTPGYRSETRLYVAVQPSADLSALEVGQGNTAAKQKVLSYSDVARSALVLQPVIDELSLDTTVDELADRVSSVPPTDTVILTIAVTDPDPDVAAVIANAIGAELSHVVSERLEAGGDGAPSPVQLETLQPATPSSTPVTPGLVAHLAVGLLLGGALGVALATLRRALETKVRGDDDVAEITDVPVVGTVPFDPQARTHPLTVQVDPLGPRAEAFRGLRTSLQFLDMQGTRRSVMVTSPMPSEGKSTSICNLAIALAQAGRRVALVDADLRRPRVAEIMGIEGAVGVTDVLIGAAELDDVVQPWGRDQLVVLPAGQTPPNPAELVGSLGMQALVAELGSRFDHVLVDAPPLLPVSDASAMAGLVDGALVVAASGRTHKALLTKALDLLHGLGSPALGIVVTMVPFSGRSGSAYSTYYTRPPQAERPAARRRAPLRGGTR